MRRQIAAVLIGLIVLPQLVSGQTLTPGSRVRFSHPGEGTRTGTLVALTADTLQVRLPDRAEPARLPLDQVTRLDVSRGRQRHMWYGGVGLIAGAGLGALGGAASASDQCAPQDLICGRGSAAALGAAFFGAIGGVLGLVAGVVPSERWQPVQSEARRISLVAPSASRARGVGVRVAF